MKTLYPLKELNLRQLTEKLVMLMALGTGFRVQSLSLIKRENIKISKTGVEIRVNDIVKTSIPGAEQPYAFLPYFESKPKVCIASTLVHYLKVTSKLRNGESSLFITYKKPHKRATTQTVCRWLKSVLSACGISNEFTAHSTRHASTSAALRRASI